jgi:hypothetical protein
MIDYNDFVAAMLDDRAGREEAKPCASLPADG